MRKMSWKRMWLHIAKGFSKPVDIDWGYLGNADYNTAVICPILYSMEKQGLISLNMYDRASNLIDEKLKRKRGCFLYELGTAKGCKLRAAFCRRQALKGA